MSARRNHTDLELELLDAELWDCPARLSAEDGLEHAGPDWRQTPVPYPDREDEA